MIEKKKELKARVIYLNKKWVKEEIRADQQSTDPEVKHAKDRKHLERSLDSERGMITKNSKTFEKANTKYLKENVILINELNTLKKELRKIQRDKKAQKQSMMMGGNNSSIRSNYSGRNIPPQTLKELRMQDEAIA